MSRKLSEFNQHDESDYDRGLGMALFIIDRYAEQEPSGTIQGSTYGGVSWGGTYKPQEPCDDAVSRRAVNILVDELARAISDERCCISRGRSTATIMQDILDLPSVKPQEPCYDVISREAAILLASIATLSVDETVEAIKRLPSVQPKQKTGHWIDDTKYGGTECSECGKWYLHTTIAKNEIMYCPECGARMESEDADSD